MQKSAAKKNRLIIKLIEIQVLTILRRPSMPTDAPSAAITSSAKLVLGSDLIAFLSTSSYVFVPRCCPTSIALYFISCHFINHSRREIRRIALLMNLILNLSELNLSKIKVK